MVNDSENGQALLYGMGDQHLDVVVSKLAERYKVEKCKKMIREAVERL